MTKAAMSALAASLCVAASGAAAQDAPEPGRLRDEIAAADAEFFRAFNVCDLDRIGAVFAPDLEFFHDTGGLTGYAETMANTRANCERRLGLVRTLVEGSLEVHPIADYGAIELGRHTFCHVENGRNDCGTFGFVTIWKRSGDDWKIARVVSYGH